MRTFVLAMLMGIASIIPSLSQAPLLYFRQDFCEPGFLLQSDTPDAGQFDHIITTSSATVNQGECFFDAARTSATGGGSVRILRTSPFAIPAPEMLHVKIDLEVKDITLEGNIAGYFAVGDGLIHTHTLLPNASLFSKLSIDFKSDGTYALRVPGTSGAVLSNPLNGRIRLTWVMNNKSDNLTYLSPLETTEDVAPGKYDVWINEYRWISGGNAISLVNLNNFAFILSNGVGIVRLHHIEINSTSPRLPLVLTRFEAERRLQETQVYWEMAAGHTASQFTVERSSDGTNFEAIGSLSVADLSQNLYRFADPSPLAGFNYYRLKMTGETGEVRFSRIDAVYFDSSAPDITISPNPSLPDRITLLATGINPENISLFTMTGLKLQFGHGYDNSGMMLSIYPATPLPSGIYLLRIAQNRLLKTVKVVIP